MNKKIKTALIAAAGCVGAGGILMGVGSAMGGYSELGKINMAQGWRGYERAVTPLRYSVYSLPGVGSLLAELDDIALSGAQEAAMENWADGLEDSAEEWADGFEDGAEEWADSFEDGVENWADGVENRMEGWSDGVENRVEGMTDDGYYNGAEQNMEQEVFTGDFEKDIAFTEMPAAIEVEIGVHCLKLVEGDTGKIRLEGRNADRIQCYVENGTLYLKDVGTHKKYKKTNGRELTLTVPAGTEWKTAVLDADMGYVQAETLSAKTAVLKTEMGSIELGKLKADFAEASGEMGNVEVEEAEIKGLKAEAEMGNIVFAGTVKGTVEADSEMGSITLRLRQKQEEFDYRVSSEMGEVKVGGVKYGLADGREKTVDNGADWRMDLETSMGSIEILFE